MHIRPGVLLLLCAISSPAMVSAQAIHNLERGLPLEIQDTATTDTGKIQIQGSAINEQSDAGDRLTLEPNIQWGVAENLHLTVHSPYYLGDESLRTGSGDIYAGALYNFLAEGQWLPGAAVLGEVVAPTGVASDGLDTAVTFILSKQITKESSEDRIHFNVQWYHNAIPSPGERDDRYTYVIGYSRKLNDKTVLVLDFVRRDEVQVGQASNLMEIGFLYQLSSKVVLGAGLGTGIDEDSPDLRMGISLQVTLGG
jgi:hypothetical protein